MDERQNYIGCKPLSKVELEVLAARGGGQEGLLVGIVEPVASKAAMARTRDACLRSGEGPWRSKARTHQILVTVVFVFRATASFAAPCAPSWLPYRSNLAIWCFSTAAISESMCAGRSSLL